VVIGWKLILKSPRKGITGRLNRAVNFVLVDLDKWIKTTFVKALVHGGLGIEGIRETPFYKFISSPEGLSQLGIEPTEPPKLLKAYERTIKVSRKGRQLILRFGDVALLKLATPHPARGTGNLQVQSWLEWIVDDVNVGRGFVPRERIPSGADKAIRLGQPLGGLMLPRGALGSSGLWRFPVQLQDYERAWLKGNVKSIEQALLAKMVELLVKRANG